MEKIRVSFTFLSKVELDVEDSKDKDFDDKAMEIGEGLSDKLKSMGFSEVEWGYHSH